MSKPKSTFRLFLIVIALWFIHFPVISQSVKNSGPTKTIRLLTIGNSFSNNACKYLSQIAASIPGYKIEITKANIGGCSLEKHANLIATCKKDNSTKPYNGNYCLVDMLKQGPYDIVTIQQLSLLSFKPESYQPYANTIVEFVKQHAPGAEIRIHQTWAYAEDCQRFEKLGISREEMHTGIVNSYQALADELNLEILPSGNAFYQASKKYPTIDLWSKDRYHASDYGCYLAGCVWFGELFGVSPQKVKFVPESIEPKSAERLRKIAVKVHSN